MFYDNFVALCASVNKTPAYVGRELGIDKSTISCWKARKTKPSDVNAQKIADYFNVSTDYLLGRTDNPKLYTTPDGKEVDLSDLRNSVVLFDGKPLSDDDVYKIEQIIKLSIGVSGSEDR